MSREIRPVGGGAGEPADGAERPILFVDVDGVLSLFGFDPSGELPGAFHSVDGILHCIGKHAGERLGRLTGAYELVWATGWEEKANEYLPHLLAMPGPLPLVSFGEHVKTPEAHWKVAAIDAHAADRPAAWIDDALDERCVEWARGRAAPTLLVETESATGITDEHVELLLRWAEEVRAGDRR